MNRLILIGNGFDLAHGLKTDYNSFIVWYLKECFNKGYASGAYSDPLITIEKITTFDDLHKHNIKNPSDLVDKYYNDGFEKLLKDAIKIEGWQTLYSNPLKLSCNSIFSKALILNCNCEHWVDIENEFYFHLKSCRTEKAINIAAIGELNESLKFIIEQLEIYLTSLGSVAAIRGYSEILRSYIDRKEILNCKLDFDRHPEQSLILTFNYTLTAEEYLKNYRHVPNENTTLDIVHIHGRINDPDDPLIFGFGDELDDDYKKIELTNINEFFEYIKSFWYFKTSNYHDLMRFIESDEYQIFILGHSCGLSDRTLLHMLFEHSNCKTIKIYYHGNKTKNNYTRLTQEISRHFSDKVAMRNKIVPLDKSFHMPQV